MLCIKIKKLGNAFFRLEDGRLNTDALGSLVADVGNEIRFVERTHTSGHILDGNGNTCGEWTLNAAEVSK